MNNEDDVLFKNIGSMLREKRITDIRDIFNYIPIKKVAQKLAMDEAILLDFIKNPGAYKLAFIYQLAEIFDYDSLEMSYIAGSLQKKLL